MGKILSQKITDFSGGMVNDNRSKRVGVASFIKNFDALTYKHRLVPKKSSEEGQDTVSRKIVDMCYVNGRLYGYGVAANGTTGKLFYKDTFTDGSWTAAPGGEVDGAGDVVRGTLIHYKGSLYVADATNLDWQAYNLTTETFASTVSLVHGAVNAHAVVHSKDDSLYIAGTNTIKRNNAGSWTSLFQLPTSHVITSICEYGNYLAIAMKPVSTANLGEVSRVFLWDRDSSITTLAESIDWGLGDIEVLEELEGYLIGISLKTDTTLLNGSTHYFKYYAGAGGAVEFQRFSGLGFSALTALKSVKQKTNNRIYFMAAYVPEDASSKRDGVWSVGRNSPTDPFSVNIEYSTNNDSTSTSLDGFFLLGDVMFTAASNSGTLDGNMRKTDNATAYTASSYYESVILDMDDPSMVKKLLSVTVTTNPLPSGGQVVLKYRRDGGMNTEATWTTIFTHTTVTAGSFVGGRTYTIISVGTTDFTLIGASANTPGVTFVATGVGSGTGVASTGPVSHTAVNIESSGVNLPEFNEIQFQIISTGGAIITGLYYEAEIIDKKL